ncbi:MAG: hypothetical protein OK456_06080 [Thaumarchaeota archaeon]|nr:hypothetical protein [Nitrososphaerota archaeon]
MSHRLQISIEPYRKIVVHEVLEIGFNDLIDQIVNQARSAGGTTIPLLAWCNGVAFQIAPFNPNSEEIIRESLRGTVHYAAVTFALKEKYEREIIRKNGTVILLNQSANANFVALAETMLGNSKLKETG